MAIRNLFRKPLELQINKGSPQGRVVCCTTAAINKYFYKVGGWLSLCSSADTQ